MGDMILWFPKGKKEHNEKFKKWWFGPYKMYYCLPKNIVLLVNIDKFERNPILLNINKLKPYKYLGKILWRLEATIRKGKRAQGGLTKRLSV
jgi:hypothetical protein